MCQGDNATKIDSVIFPFNSARDEKLYDERWLEFFPKHGAAASVPAGSVPAGPVPVARGPAASAPSAAAPDKKRSASASVASAGSIGGQSKKTRHGMAAAGVQPTPATTDRMYLVLEDSEGADGPSLGPKRTFAERQAGIERPAQQPGGGATRTLSQSGDGRGQPIPGTHRICKSYECGKPYFGSKRQACPHCGWQVQKR